MKNLIDDCPGVCGEIARLIDSQLEYSRPQLSLLAALGFCATLKCGRLVSPDGIEPNIYLLSIAPSGSGKTQVQKILTKIIRECGLPDLLIGDPASDSGLLRAIADQPRCLLPWDEFGISLSELAQTKTGPKAQILSTAMRLFSVAGDHYIGKQYSQQARVDIKAPYLNILASSTPDRFYDALNKSFIDDGFLPRWLIMPDCKFVDSDARKIEPFKVPNSIWSYANKFDKWEPSKSTGDLAKLLQVDKQIVIFEKGNIPLRWRYKNTCRKNMDAAKSDSERIFWSRAYELFVKLCLAVTDGVNISWETEHFAEELITYCLFETVFACEGRLGRSNKQKLKDELFNLIGAGQKISASQLSKITYKMSLSRIERRQFIDDFIESELWITFDEANDGSRRKTKFYARPK